MNKINAYCVDLKSSVWLLRIWKVEKKGKYSSYYCFTFVIVFLAVIQFIDLLLKITLCVALYIRIFCSF